MIEQILNEWDHKEQYKLYKLLKNKLHKIPDIEADTGMPVTAFILKFPDLSKNIKNVLIPYSQYYLKEIKD